MVIQNDTEPQGIAEALGSTVEITVEELLSPWLLYHREFRHVSVSQTKYRTLLGYDLVHRELLLISLNS